MKFTQREMMIIGGATVVAILTIGLMWDAVFGASPDAAMHSESLHHALMRFIVALAVALAATVLSLVALTVVMDPLTARREFLEKVERGEAGDAAMAIFSVGTAIFAGAVFVATLGALSL